MPQWQLSEALPPGWQELQGEALDEIWRRFSRSFQFRPSTERADWPSIRERAPFVTYELPAFKTIQQENVWQTFLHAFQQLSQRPGQEALYVLDWHHACYELKPALATSTWVVPIVPHGDYTIFLEGEFRYGVFGHPWERSLHVFGTPLLDKLAKSRLPELKTVLRCSPK